MKRGLQTAVLAAAGLYVYWPALNGGWLWDDRAEIGENHALRGLTGLADIWRGRAGPDYYPLLSTLQWGQWHLWGGATFGYHATNLVLHVLSAILLWRLLEKLGLSAAWWGALIFVAHPVAVESVAWMTELKNAASLPPALLALSAYVDEEGRPGKPSPARAFVWFLVSMLVKTAGAMLPLVFLLYAWWRHGRLARSDLRRVAPFAAVSLALGVITIWLQQHRSIQAPSFLPGGAGGRLDAAGLTAAFYFFKSAVPFRLIPLYPHWPVDPARWVQFLPWFPAAGAGVWLGARGTPAARAVLLGLGFFFLNLAPVLGFIPISHMRFTWAMDHLAYLSLIGLAGLAAAGLGRAAGAARRWRPGAAPTIWTAAAVGLAGLAVASRGYAAIFRSDEALWSHTLRLNPGAWLADNGLGGALLLQGRTEEAIPRLRAALALKPDYAEADNNLGDALRREGKGDEAVAYYGRAVRARPASAVFHNNFALALDAAGRGQAAVAEAETAIRLDPGFDQARNNLGVFLARAGRGEEAMDCFRRAVWLNPNNAEAYGNLGAMLARAGRLNEAMAEYRRALAIDPNLGSARQNLAAAEREIAETDRRGAAQR